MSRKVLLQVVSLVLLFSMLLVACAPAATPTKAPEATQPPATSTSKYKEAPMLAELVKAGKLPPVEERLPKNPLVVTNGKEIGQYGGNWRMGLRGGTDDASMIRIFTYEAPLRWSVNWDAVEPNIVDKYEISPDATQYTLHIREGMKWSDGKPFTSEDIMFWYNDVALNKELSPTPHSLLKAGGEVGKLEKIDDYTVKFTFKQPYGLFEQYLAHVEGYQWWCYQKEYSSQFHINYVDKAKLDEMAKAGGYASWVQLFQGKAMCQAAGLYGVKGRPTLHAWITEEPYLGNATQVTFVRNPYYWKVDPQGNQLPYIDKITFTVFQDVPAMLLKATNGEIDFQMRHYNTLDNKAVLFDNMAKGDYHIFDLTDAANNKIIIHFNLTHKDPAKRAVFSNKDFRIGMSYAINRQEIIDTVFVGQAKPWQPAPLEGTPFYNEQLAKQYLEYDVAKANEYLDKAGLKKGADGMRTLPDGKPLTIVLEIANANVAEVDTGNMLSKYWKAVGVNVEAKPVDRTIMYNHKDGNDLDAMLWQGDGGINPMMDMRAYFPYSTESAYAVPWALWYSGATGGLVEEPPAEVKEIMALFDKVKGTVGFENQVAVMKELLQKSADYFFCIGILTPPDSYGTVKNNFKNVPDRFIFAWPYPSPAPLNPPIFFFSK